MVDVAQAHSFANRLTAWRSGLSLATSPFRLRDERPADAASRDFLLDAAFGAGRFTKTCERLREGREAAAGLSFVAMQDGVLIGTLRLWNVEVGDRASLMLGPLAVSAACRSGGIGRAMIEHALRRARRLGHDSVILVGDAAYYERFGFRRALTLGLTLPGPVDEARFLGLDLVPGALAGAHGRVVGTGRLLHSFLEGEYRLAA